MEFNLTISHVNGNSTIVISTNDLEDVEQFLERYNHNGAQISLSIDVDQEDVYRIIGLVKDFQKLKRSPN